MSYQGDCHRRNGQASVMSSSSSGHWREMRALLACDVISRRACAVSVFLVQEILSVIRRNNDLNRDFLW